MPSLDWSDALAVHQPQMDATHREFVALLAAVEGALDQPAPQLRQRFAALVEHTLGHFGQEEAWMQALGFAPENCHSLQHAGLLNVLREALRWADRGDLSPMPILVQELAAWFPVHAQTMDAALAMTMAERGFDAATGRAAHAAPAGAAPTTGCGSAACTPAAEAR
jgi:hemerythrin-like metal-binding protein